MAGTIPLLNVRNDIKEENKQASALPEASFQVSNDPDHLVPFPAGLGKCGRMTADSLVLVQDRKSVV